MAVGQGERGQGGGGAGRLGAAVGRGRAERGWGRAGQGCVGELGRCNVVMAGRVCGMARWRGEEAWKGEAGSQFGGRGNEWDV